MALACERKKPGTWFLFAAVSRQLIGKGREIAACAEQDSVPPGSTGLPASSAAQNPSLLASSLPLDRRSILPGRYFFAGAGSPQYFFAGAGSPSAVPARARLGAFPSPSPRPRHAPSAHPPAPPLVIAFGGRSGVPVAVPSAPAHGWRDSACAPGVGGLVRLFPLRRAASGPARP